MFARVIADRYAHAVMSDCPDLPTIEAVKADLSLLAEAFSKYISFRQFLMNPKIPAALKRKIVDNAFGSRLNPATIRLLKLLIEKRRQGIIPEISDKFVELCDRVRGVEAAEITLAAPIPAELAKNLEMVVQRFSSRQVEVTQKIDPRILGGVVVRMGDRVIDGSLRHRFEEARRTMLAIRLPKAGSQAR
jgi:F-type H+-transporting ATPase subunit delta